MALASASLTTAAPPVFGRGEIRERIRRLLDRAAREGRGGGAVLVGDEGAGKSTLLRSLAAAARERRFVVAEVRAVASDLPRPYALLHDILQGLPHAPDPERPDAVATASLSLLLAPLAAGTDPRESVAFGGPIEGDPDAGEAARLLDALASPGERSDANRAQLFEGVTRYLKERASRAPVFVAIDDLHWADEQTVRYLRELGRVFAELPVVLVGTALPESSLAARPAELLRRTRGLATVLTLDIPPFQESDAREFVRYLRDGHSVRPDLLERWYAESRGNPLLLEQLARGPTSAGGDEGWESGAADEFPQRWEEYTRRKLQALPPSDRRALAYGATFGREFEFAALVAACGEGEDGLSESLDRLVRQGILREKAGERYEFVREPLRAEAYALLSETRRKILHRKVANALEARKGAEGTDVYELARQFYLAQESAKAVEYNRRAAELARGAYAYRSAISYFERALESSRGLPSEDRTTRLHLRIELGRTLQSAGELVRAVEVLDRALADARGGPRHELELALALMTLAEVRAARWEYAVARDMATEAQGILERRGHRRGIMVVHGILGRVAWCEGDFVATERHQRIAVNLAMELGDRLALGHALVDWANTLLYMGPERADEALGRYNRAVEIFTGIREDTALSRALMDRAILFHNLGRMDEAFRDLRAAIKASERGGSYVYQVYSYLNEAQFRTEVHDLGTVRALLDRSRELNDRLGDPLVPQQIAMIEGMLAEEERNWAGAREAYERALEMTRKLEMVPDLVEMHVRLARLGWKSGDLEFGRRHMDEALRHKVLEVRGDLAATVAEIRQGLEGSSGATEVGASPAASGDASA